MEQARSIAETTRSSALNLHFNDPIKSINAPRRSQTPQLLRDDSSGVSPDLPPLPPGRAGRRRRHGALSQNRPPGGVISSEPFGYSPPSPPPHGGRRTFPLNMMNLLPCRSQPRADVSPAAHRSSRVRRRHCHTATLASVSCEALGVRDRGRGIGVTILLLMLSTHTLSSSCRFSPERDPVQAGQVTRLAETRRAGSVSTARGPAGRALPSATMALEVIVTGAQRSGELFSQGPAAATMKDCFKRLEGGENTTSEWLCETAVDAGSLDLLEQSRGPLSVCFTWDSVTAVHSVALRHAKLEHRAAEVTGAVRNPYSVSGWTAVHHAGRSLASASLLSLTATAALPGVTRAALT
ncbi:hypothetical protein AAFF_G00196640 [Aldrovandia affinis]|uniref:Uncharacterized protein n=1 Tax=Aldrovandia affinis TaxID=143900 RepID=A0AAD7RIJ8_9TELE|nr:hypothetical protein AAFF_G00196640 [Aldrovandia affinis]